MNDEEYDEKEMVLKLAPTFVGILVLIVAILAYINASAAYHAATNINSTIASQIKYQVANAMTPLVAQINASTSYSLITDNALGTEVSALSAQVQGLNSSSSVNNDELSLQISGVNTNISSIRSNVSGIPSLLETLPGILMNATARLQDNQRYTLNMSNYTIPENGYFFGVFPGKFATHLNFTANQSVVLNILTYQQFANLASNRSFSTIAEYTGSAQSLWFNQSEGCSAYVYTITGDPSPFTIRMNDTVVYAPSNTATGVC